MDVFYAYQNDIAYEHVNEARSQNRLWEKNFDCIREDKEVYVATTDSSDIVKVAACEGTGDVIVEVNFQDGRKIAKWVAFDKVCNICEGSLWDMATVHAESQTYRVVVICQKWLDHVRLFRRVSVHGVCYDEVVNTLTGKIEKRTEVECRPCVENG